MERRLPSAARGGPSRGRGLTNHPHRGRGRGQDAAGTGGRGGQTPAGGGGQGVNRDLDGAGDLVARMVPRWRGAGPRANGPLRGAMGLAAPGGGGRGGAGRGGVGGAYAERGGAGRDGRGGTGGFGAERGGRGRGGHVRPAQREGYSVDRRGFRQDERRHGRGGGHKGRDRHRSQSVARGEQPQVYKMGFKLLEELSTKEPSEVAITLASKSGFRNTLDETPMRQDLVELICVVLCRAFQNKADRGTRTHLAAIVKDSSFLCTTLSMYLAGVASESNPARREQYPQHLLNILAIVLEVVSIYPASSVQAVSMIATLLQSSIDCLEASGVDVPSELRQKVENLGGVVSALQEKSREGALRADKDFYALLTPADDEEDEEEHEDFRSIPIYPTPHELQHEQRPFLRQNRISRRYTNTHLYLDTHFRLLREDFARSLREGIQQVRHIQLNLGGADQKALTAQRFDDIRLYFDVQLLDTQCTSKGVAYLVKFDTKSLKGVRWQNSKRLLFGSLVCLSSDYFESILFATVSDRDPKHLQKGLIQLTFTEDSRYMLSVMERDPHFLMVETTAFFEAYRHVLEGLKEQEEATLPFHRYIVECSGDLQPPAYLRGDGGDVYNLSAVVDPQHKARIKSFHSLRPEAWPSKQALGLDESQMRAFQLALTKELAIIQGPPGTGKTHVGLKIAQALLTNQHLWTNDYHASPMLVVCYTNHALDQFLEGILKFMNTGIVRVGGQSSSEVLKKYNLRVLSQAPRYKQHIPSHLRFACNEIYEQLRTQEKVIKNNRLKMGCCQRGVLRANVLRSHISATHWQSLQTPLDPFGIMGSDMILEWLGLCSMDPLLEEDTMDDVEHAGDSEDEQMQEDLINIAEEADLIQAERMIDDNMDDAGWRELEGDVDALSKEEEMQQLERNMMAMDLDAPEIQTVQAVPADIWQFQSQQKKNMKKRIKKQLQNHTTMTEADERIIRNVWTLDKADKWNLYRLWVSRYHAELRMENFRAEQEYQVTVDRLADVRRQETILILKDAKVIGMTTTGAARLRQSLQEVGPSVIVVEEAAEVQEAHIITTLSRACRHLILIGDHQQLRPSTTVYDLAKNFNLEVSMFERLVKMEVPYVRLDFQHRMRPEIARLLTPHIYSELENHPSVLNYEKIKGLSTNLFFVEHKHAEEQIKEGKSHRNQHEAEFVVALCRYLLLQEYKPEQITILTTYTGQLHCLRSLMPASQFSGVRVHVVDKYQGEENDIVLLSLVRSNKQGKVGFLNIPNRVCVALSRARKGLYCIGDRSMLSKVELWSNIFRTLSQNGQVGSALTLCCQNHPARLLQAACAEDFRQAPEGGCLQPCDYRLACGHVCEMVCHPYDMEHEKYNCLKKCEKTLCDLGHGCPLVCHQTCPPCPVKMEKIVPTCQHKQIVPCHQDPDTFVCQKPCQKALQCGHPCRTVCGAPCTKLCQQQVTFELKCGHRQDAACYYNTMDHDPKCKTLCLALLQCGHSCPGTCSECFQGRFHMPCSHNCDRVLVCSHICKEPCTRDCPPCTMPCENRCVHSKCKKPCGQPCAPCAEPCAWRCPHFSCTKLCHEPCDRPPCSQPCQKLLKCGHACIGLCGDKCPRKCRVCNEEEVTEIFFGTEDDPEARFIQLEDCGHIFESAAMDQWMEEDQQQQGGEGETVAIKLKECPRCRTPIRKNLRYGTHVNRRLAEIEMVKGKINRQGDVDAQRDALRRQWSTLVMTQIPECAPVLKQLQKLHLTANNLWVLENKMDFQLRIQKLQKVEHRHMLAEDAITFHENTNEFQTFLDHRRQKFTEQQVVDLERELLRLTLSAEFNAHHYMAHKMGQTDKVRSEMETTRAVLQKTGPLADQDVAVVKNALRSLEAKLPKSGLQLSEEERKMIVSAMNQKPGHWYKCPNGHVYVITECGGAMESRKCTDCDATIGGRNHALSSGNQVASEMDGARHAAWSNANNLLNYEEFRDL